MIKQIENNPFAGRSNIDRYELMVMSEDLVVSYRYCTSFRHLKDGRLLLERKFNRGALATATKFAKKFAIIRVRDFLA